VVHRCLQRVPCWAAARVVAPPAPRSAEVSRHHHALQKTIVGMPNLVAGERSELGSTI
jgi:hypothetical protein